MSINQNNRFSDLIAALDPERRVIIQTHNYPDHDAIASAYGLSFLFDHYGINNIVCYGEDLLSHSLKVAIRVLKIPVYHWESLELGTEDQIVQVDGNFSNANIAKLPGEIIGVVDHHPIPTELNIPYWDVRDDVGSCSSLIYDYYYQTQIQPERDIATSLLMGIMMDTAYLTRRVSQLDLDGFNYLYKFGQWDKGSFILKNSLSVAEVPAIKQALWNAEIKDEFCFSYINMECAPDLLALIADDFLRYREIHFIVIASKAEKEIKISVRSEDNRKSAGDITKQALEGIGFGGGHTHMGGGVIPIENFPGREELYERFVSIIGL
ncbi:DHH family phosphoesterase [Spirochaeta cellobiosiphila]|uniref:DHH family phosphoesterase n=1 Tax=Spirochaeta cellobiosiphila TaxID=504483 RepID=UPI0003FF3B28|nr:DHH family phosphoesterase [Spirochaeta cellobiosiphila]